MRCVIAFSVLSLTAVLAVAQQKPNIIHLLADDVGYDDIGCFGSTDIHTPNLDGMASAGMIFTDFYAPHGTCTPSRAAILTGRYAPRVNNGTGLPVLFPDSDIGLDTELEITITELLKEQGYETALVGKWHLGHEKEFAPLARGFDRMYGIPKGGGVYFYPCIGRDRQVFLNDEQVFPDSSWYSTDAFTDYAIEFAKEATADQKPFFMYLAYIAPHFPLQARIDDINKYRGKYSNGYEFYRNQRFQKQKALGVVNEHTQLSSPDYELWNDVKNKEQEDLKMAVYAAQVDRMDQNIGRLTDQLKTMGIYDNTIIFFLSDNGAINVGMNDTPEAQIGSRDSWAAYGQSWGNVSNTPYRYYKRMTHEGGVITPLIVHWPDGKVKNGLISHEPVHIIDFMPTLLDIAGGSYPTSFQNQDLVPIMGQSFLPLLNGTKQYAGKTMYWEHEGNKAVRKGDWKLVKKYKNPWELYQLNVDPTEIDNVAIKYPDLFDSLKNDWQVWADKVGVEDWPVE